MNYPRNSKVVIYLCILIVIVILGGLSWINYQVAEAYPGGNAFHVYWSAIRQFLFEGVSPYNVEVALEIQHFEPLVKYIDQPTPARFASPLFSILILAPFSLINDFVLARTAWMTFLETCLFLSALITLRICKWKTGFATGMIYIGIAFLSYFSIKALITGDLIIISGLFFCIGILAFLKGDDELSGAMFALATIKLQYGIVLVIFMLFWSITKQRHKFSLWFLITLSFLSAIMLLIKPGWILEMVQASLANISTLGANNTAGMLRNIFPGIGVRMGWVISAIIFAILVFEWANAREYDGKRLIWLICLTLAGGALSGLPAPAESLVLLLPVMPFLAEVLMERWRGGGLLINFMLGAAFLAGTWLAVYSDINKTGRLAENTAVLIILAISVFLLFWNRHWLMSSVRPWYDRLESGDSNRKK